MTVLGQYGLFRALVFSDGLGTRGVCGRRSSCSCCNHISCSSFMRPRRWSLCTPQRRTKFHCAVSQSRCKSSSETANVVALILSKNGHQKCCYPGLVHSYDDVHPNTLFCFGECSIIVASMITLWKCLRSCHGQEVAITKKLKLRQRQLYLHVYYSSLCSHTVPRSSCHASPRSTGPTSRKI